MFDTYRKRIAHIFSFTQTTEKQNDLNFMAMETESSLGLSWHIWGIQLLWFVLKSMNRAGWSCFTEFLPTYNLTLPRTTTHRSSYKNSVFINYSRIFMKSKYCIQAHELTYCKSDELCLCKQKKRPLPWDLSILMECWIVSLWCIVVMDRLLKSIGQEVHAFKHVQKVFDW